MTSTTLQPDLNKSNASETNKTVDSLYTIESNLFRTKINNSTETWLNIFSFNYLSSTKNYQRSSTTTWFTPLGLSTL